MMPRQVMKAPLQGERARGFQRVGDRIQHGQRPLEMRGRFLERQVRQRAVPRLPRVTDRLAGVGNLRGIQPMVGQLVDARSRRGAVSSSSASPTLRCRRARRAALSSS